MRHHAGHRFLAPERRLQRHDPAHGAAEEAQIVLGHAALLKLPVDEAVDLINDGQAIENKGEKMFRLLELRALVGHPGIIFLAGRAHLDRALQRDDIGVRDLIPELPRLLFPIVRVAVMAVEDDNQAFRLPAFGGKKGKFKTVLVVPLRRVLHSVSSCFLMINYPTGAPRRGQSEKRTGPDSEKDLYLKSLGFGEARRETSSRASKNKRKLCSI